MPRYYLDIVVGDEREAIARFQSLEGLAHGRPRELDLATAHRARAVEHERYVDGDARAGALTERGRDACQHVPVAAGVVADEPPVGPGGETHG